MTRKGTARALVAIGGAMLFAAGFLLGRSDRRAIGADPSGNPLVGQRLESISDVGVAAERLQSTMQPPDREGVRVAANSGDRSEPSVERPTMLDAFTIFREALAAPASSSTAEGYLAKYAGASPQDLRIAELALTIELNSQTKRIGSELMAAGRYESQIVGPGYPVPEPMSSRGKKVVSLGYEVHSLGDGRSEIRTSLIDPAEFPQIAQLQDESHWLGTYLRHNLGIR